MTIVKVHRLTDRGKDLLETIGIDTKEEKKCDCQCHSMKIHSCDCYCCKTFHKIETALADQKKGILDKLEQAEIHAENDTELRILDFIRGFRKQIEAI